MKKKSQNILNAAKYTIDHPETSITQAAKMFGVDPMTIYYAYKGITWKHLDYKEI